MEKACTAAVLIAAFLAVAPPATAGVPVDLKIDTLVYGDNTEFFNPYRTGETTLGAWTRLSFSARLAENVAFIVGVYGNERFGSEYSFEEVRPVISLRVGSERGRLVFGTLETVRRAEGIGPDLTTPHGLLPPVQIEVFSFTRPYENGLQWILDTDRVKNDVWLNWQKLNTPDHREELEAGTAGRIYLDGPFWAGLQVHVVHHGGQLYDVGPVTDSFAYGPGLLVAPRFALFDRVSAEAYLLFSKDKRDRENPQLTTSGHGAFVRLAAEKEGWRAHLILWRASNFVKEEGDPNYQSRSEDGTFYRATRNYAELGLAKSLRVATGVALEPSFRLHRTDNDLEYSYRLIARVSFDVPVLDGSR
jgi:hypothetical protein